MELLNSLGNPALRLWLAQAATVFFLISGVAVLAAGMMLLVNSAGALRFFGSMNRWVSVRRMTKPLEVSRDTRSAVQKYRFWLAAFCIASGLFALSGLITRYDAKAIIVVFGLDDLRPVVAVWLVDSARWLLLIGNLAVVTVGVMLAFFPGALAALESRGSDWYSERKVAKGMDTMTLRLDDWVASYPRAAGAIITVFGLALIGAFAMIMPVVW